MDNFMLFAGGFVSYLITFIVFIAAILIACFIGIAIRKNKNKKLEALATDNTSEVVADSEKA